MLSKHFDFVSPWVTFSFADFFIIIIFYHFAKILSMIRSNDRVRVPIHVLSTLGSRGYLFLIDSEASSTRRLKSLNYCCLTPMVKSSWIVRIFYIYFFSFFMPPKIASWLKETDTFFDNITSCTASYTSWSELGKFIRLVTSSIKTFPINWKNIFFLTPIWRLTGRKGGVWKILKWNVCRGRSTHQK